MTDSLELVHLTKIYSKSHVALRDISLRLEKGVFGLLGPNGAGKTTLLEILALEREPEHGSLLLNNPATDDSVDAWREPAQWRAHLGFMPQHFGFLPHLSGRETLRQAALLAGIPHRDARERIEMLLEQVRLSWAAQRRVEAYSRGMRQRLGIAASLIADPVLWLLDEPTSGLDPEERVAFRRLLSEEGAKRITILSTHIVEDVERCCRHIGILIGGGFHFIGTAQDLTRSALDQVWEWEVDAAEVDRWAEDSRVVAVRALDQVARVRAVASTPPLPQARPASPTLEDAYLHLLGGLRKEKNNAETTGQIPAT